MIEIIFVVALIVVAWKFFKVEYRGYTKSSDRFSKKPLKTYKSRNNAQCNKQKGDDYERQIGKYYHRSKGTRCISRGLMRDCGIRALI